MEQNIKTETNFIKFIIIWIGQFISVIGSRLTSFGLGIWVLNETGSVTAFSYILLSATIPGILISPFAGVIVDRWKRKWIMVISDTISSLTTLVILFILLSGNLEIWHIVLTTSISSLFGSFQVPAYHSSVTLMVPKKQLGRASGLMQLSSASSILIAPVIAGALIYTKGLTTIIMIDLFTFIVAVVTLLLVKIPELKKDTSDKENKSFIKEMKLGINYLKLQKGLIIILIYGAIVNFLMGFFNLLIDPYIIFISNAQVLGIVISTSGAGMVAGGLLMSIHGGPKRKVRGLILSSSIGALGILISGITSSIILITSALTITLFSASILNASNRALWQTKIDKEYQGRVLSIRRMIQMSCMPISFLLAGPVVDKVFEPIMSESGLLADSIGKIIGTGEGRGIGLLYIVIGIVWLTVSIIIYANKNVRALDNDDEEITLEKTLATA